MQCLISTTERFQRRRPGTGSILRLLNSESPTYSSIVLESPAALIYTKGLYHRFKGADRFHAIRRFSHRLADDQLGLEVPSGAH